MFKIISLKCSWVKRLYHSITHNLKLLPLHVITQKLRKHFLFYSDLSVGPKKIRQFPKYYQEIFGSKWSSNLSVMPKTSYTKLHKSFGRINIFWLIKGLFIILL